MSFEQTLKIYEIPNTDEQLNLLIEQFCEEDTDRDFFVVSIEYNSKGLFSQTIELLGTYDYDKAEKFYNNILSNNIGI